VRAILSPTQLTRAVTSVSPDWHYLGVSPNNAPTVFHFRIRAGSSIAVLGVQAQDGGVTTSNSCMIDSSHDERRELHARQEKTTIRKVGPLRNERF
jgi:hypothetical protein